MPFVFNKGGVYYRPIELLTTQGGISKSVQSLQVNKFGILTEVWRKESAQKILILSSELPDTLDLTLNSTGSGLKLEFPESGIYQMHCIGDVANGGNGGNDWGGYSGGQGGGGGTGGCIVLKADFSGGVSHHLIVGKLSQAVQISDGSNIPTGSIVASLYPYNQNMFSWISTGPAIYYITKGNPGSAGENATAFVFNPEGGSGGTGGKVYRKFSSDVSEIPNCIGYNGGSGGSGYDSRPPISVSHGHAGEAPPVINVYDGLGTVPEVDYHLGNIDNVYQRPNDYYTADINRPNAIQGYTLDHIALGNGGAGGWNTVVDGSFPAGQGALGGVVIEKIS